MGKSPLLTFGSWDNLKLQDLGLYNNNKELMTEDDFEKTSLETEGTWEGRACAEGGVP